MKISDNFKRSEFRCRCGYCGKSTADALLVYELEKCRAHFNNLYDNVSIKINSGHRCVTHNKKEGGADKSKHLDGIAADFVVVGVAADEVAQWLESEHKGKYGIGRYTGRTHLDVRAVEARWDRRGM